MAWLLERLEPLVEMLKADSDPAEKAGALLRVIDEDAVPENDDLSLIFRHAGILTPAGRFSADARDQIIRAEALAMTGRNQEDEGWEPVVTIPPYLRGALGEAAVKETFQVIRRMIAEAENTVVIASPFLDSGFGRFIPGLAHVVRRGGTVELVTRQLSRPDSDNSTVVADLRAACKPEGGVLRVASWDEERLGLHLKAVIVDSRIAYVGSANFTWGGLADHMELGVLLRGRAVDTVAGVVASLSKELHRRTHLQSR